jgi:hypothetical protein
MSCAQYKTISTYLEVIAFLLEPDMQWSFSHARQCFLVNALHGPGADVAAVSLRHDLTKVPCVSAISGQIYLRNGKTEDRSHHYYRLPRSWRYNYYNEPSLTISWSHFAVGTFCSRIDTSLGVLSAVAACTSRPERSLI